MSRLIDHFPSWMTGGGIFAAMDDMPWEDEIDGTVLDLEYFGNHAGLRQSSVLVEKMTGYEDDEVLSDVEVGRLVAIIKAKFGTSWGRIWDALKEDYDTFGLTDMTETRTPNLSVKHKASNDFKAENTQQKTSGKNTQSYFGFGGSTEKPVNKTDDIFTVKNGTTQAGYTEDETTGTETMRRVGNNGSKTNQELLQAELEARRTQFMDIIFRDVDTVLTRGSW